MRAIWIVTTILVAIATAAQAQVAAPRMNPIIPEAGGVINPATVAFSGPSRIGLGVVFDSTSEETINGVTTTTFEGEGTFLGQGRYVGDLFAIGAEADRVEFELAGTNITGELNLTMINATLLFGEFLSVGVGQQNFKLTRAGTDFTDIIPPFPAPFEFVEDNTLPLVGAVLRLGDSIYLGAASGTETVKMSVFADTSAAGGPIFSAAEEQKRDVTRFGVGYFSRDQGNGLHVEIYRENKEFIDFLDPVVNSLNSDKSEEETTGATFEVVFFSILIGLEIVNTKFSDPTGTLFNENKEEDKEVVVSLGFAPAQGFSIVASRSEEKTTFAGTPDTEKETTTFLGIGWLF